MSGRTTTVMLSATAVVLGIGYLTGFAMISETAAEAAEEEFKPSGFLSDYSRLAVDPDEKDSRLVYRNPDYDKADFDGLYLEELVFYLYPQDEGKMIDPEEAARMVELAKQFDDVLREELAKHGANLVDETGPGILHCRWAITNLGKTRSVMRVVPQARAMGALTGAGRGAATMEAECHDGESGELVAEVVKADKGKKSTGVTTWAGAESAVRKWAQGLAERMAAKK